MISEEEKEIIIKHAKKYNVCSIFLFGSALDKKNYNDIDLAVMGIEPSVFFKFYGELLRNLSKPVDLVDLSEENLFNKSIKKNSVKIYG